MLDRSVLRWGGLAAMIGAGLAFVFNLLHPRSSDAAASAMGQLHLVASSDIWVFVHFMLAWAIAFSLVGLVAIGWSFADGPGASWGRFATAAAIVGIGVGFITVLIDGTAMKHVANAMVAEHTPQSTATAMAVDEINVALFTGLIGSLFGLTPVLYGIAVLVDGTHPRGLGWLPLGAGILGLVTASIQYLAGIGNLTANILFPIVSVAFIVWLFIMGWRLWKPEAGGVREPALT